MPVDLKPLRSHDPLLKSKPGGTEFGITFLRSLLLLFPILRSKYHPIDIDFYAVGIAVKHIRLEEITDTLI